MNGVATYDAVEKLETLLNQTVETVYVTHGSVDADEIDDLLDVSVERV